MARWTETSRFFGSTRFAALKPNTQLVPGWHSHKVRAKPDGSCRANSNEEGAAAFGFPDASIKYLTSGATPSNA